MRVVAGAEEARGRAAELGGKAANLAQLELLGFPVPPWFAISTTAFAEAVASLAPRIAARFAQVPPGGDLKGAAAEIRVWIANAPPPPGLEEEIARALAVRLGEGAFVAVRSSAADEDAAGESFAGLHDSFLFVRGLAGVLDALRRVWASAYNERALAYRRSKGIPFERIAVGVVVQRMIDARTSGVVFTANPTSGAVHEVVVSALWGAGEGLVGVGLDADTFVVDKGTLEIAETIAPKAERMVLDSGRGGGLRREPVPEGERSEPSLSPEEIRALVRLALRVERFHRRPQDLEFAVDAGGTLYLLQARPVTTVEELGPAAGNALTWDNSNIIESYSGVTSPMTFSFIRRAYSIVYHCFAEVMGIDAKTVRANREVFENMLGLFRGRVYYNLLNWYRLVRLFPGFEHNRSFMESMMGVREAARFEGDAELESPPPLRGWRRFSEGLVPLVRLVLRSARNFRNIRPIVADFQAYFRDHYARWSALDFRALPPHQLAKLYREMEEKLLWEWKAPIVNDFYVMVFYGTLKKLCAHWARDEAGTLQNDLLCGEGGIESTEPAKRLLALAAEIRRQPELARAVLETSPEELARTVPVEPRFSGLAPKIADYLALYGFRCVDELKLEEPSLKERPAFLYQILRNYLAVADPSTLDGKAMEEREKRVRREAEERAFAALGGGPKGWLRRAVFRRVLRNARLGVKNRENLRFARTRIYGLLREMLQAVGHQLAAEGLLAAPADVFYLTLDEVWDYTKGRAVTTDLKGLAALRRTEFDGYRAGEPPADRFETFGLPYHRNLYRGRPQAAQPFEDGTLRGTGCCPGVVTGPVKVLRTPADDAKLDGEILVAERTDPGWVPLYPSVSGLLIERGSILSHSAIVAREMGIPTIVGIAGLIETLKTGQVVTMDGGAGVVRVEKG